MSKTSSTESKGTRAQNFSREYEKSETYQSNEQPASTSTAKTDPVPRRVISESSLKARARNKINY